MMERTDRPFPGWARSGAVRVFLSLWIIFCVHWATDFVREHFLVLSIVERQTFALDGFEDMHPDIFLFEDGHSYHGANPGISMVGAVPYFVLSPIVDRVASSELQSRGVGQTAEPEYNDPRAARRAFYTLARERGLDVRFGLIGLITQVFANAPLSALGGAVFFLVLVGMGLGRRDALLGTVLYALGTPIFMRSGYLNQNLAVGIFGLMGFALLWNPGAWCSWSRRARLILGGFCGGMALLCDYSGGLVLALLGVYALLREHDDQAWPDALRSSLLYVAGAAPPILMLWFYQWAAFGFPFYPPQHYMPPVEWSDLGYQGVAGPQLDLAMMLLFDIRFGLIVNAPVVLLALAAPFLARRSSLLPLRETLLMLTMAGAFLVLFSSVHYTRLQYITGIRYLIPVLPFLTLAAVPALLRLPKLASLAIVVASVAMSWTLAMGRPQELETSLWQTLTRTIEGGLQLPALTTLNRMSSDYVPLGRFLSAELVIAVMALAIVGVWTLKRPAEGEAPGGPS